jgi:peptidoglycan hydrolase-like protein with peptidoglycan-binding domain
LISYRNRLLSMLLCLLMLTGMAYAKTPTKSKKHRSTAAKSSKASKRGQKAMDPARVREIQAALIREKFLDGRPNGVWDQRSQDAMQKFQGANGWQTKMVPDSRAIIKLGLGPDHADLINPETAATSFIPGGGGGLAQR